MLLTIDNIKKQCGYIVDLEQEPVRDSNADWVFICGEAMNWEVELEYLLVHKVKFNLIYTRTDRFFTRQMFYAIRPKVKHIYVVNCEFLHPLITHIPHGLRDDNMPNVLEHERREILCYLNLGTYLNGYLVHKNAGHLREHCKEYFKDKDWVQKEHKVPKNTFCDRLANSKFVLCPYGVGLDTWRFYECVFYGAIPIVLSSGLDDVHEKFGALIIDDWSDVTEELLRNWKGTVNKDPLMLEYWFNFQSSQSQHQPSQ